MQSKSNFYHNYLWINPQRNAEKNKNLFVLSLLIMLPFWLNRSLNITEYIFHKYDRLIFSSSMTDWSFHQVMQYPWGEIRNVSNVRINLQGGAKLQLCTMSVASWGDCPLLIISWVVWAWQTPSQVYKGLLFSGLQLSLLLMSRKCLSSY